MHVLHGLHQMSHPLAGSVVTIGNFDGVHLGHQKLLSETVATSRRLAVPAVVITFDPHPALVLRPGFRSHRLFSFTDQGEQLGRLGIDELVIQPFTDSLARLEPAEFFEEFILRFLNPRALVVGHDFAFGRERRGDLHFLESFCGHRGIGLSVVPPVMLEGRVISSSLIREVLRSGDMEAAHRYLGRPYFLQGPVLQGEGRGRRLGVPTANFLPETGFFPRTGVYVTRTSFDSRSYASITNIGTNPTVTLNGGLHAETHLFDFSGNLYGRVVRVELLSFLRDERRFDGVESLRDQIHRDLAEARRRHGVPS